jgi:hypothetical protein
MITIEFEYIKDEFYKLKDAIVLDDNHNFTDEQIEQIKQQRIKNWLNVISPPVEEE